MKTCYRCGEAGGAVEVTRDDVIMALGALCERCFAECALEAKQLGEEFDALLAAGLSREEANARMIEKIEGRAAQA